MDKWFKIHPSDNVAIAVTDLLINEIITIECRPIRLIHSIEAGHKFAIQDIPSNGFVFKYGYSIGYACAEIKSGEHVHTHNLKTNLQDNLEYLYQPVKSKIEIPKSDLAINGFIRKNGEMGIRNELWIIPTVGCVNGQAQLIIDRVKKELDVSHIDDIRVYTHNYGCSQLGDDHVYTQKALAALVRHPNAGGVLVLGLGCENNQLPDFKKVIGDWDENRVRFLIAQEVEDEVQAGFEFMADLVEGMCRDKREKLPLSLLKVGLKCGGSDAFSGITANPLLGQFSDWLVAQGGTTVLTEVPEMFGAETILMNRSANMDTFQQTVALINNFKDYFREHDLPIYENPSPGNKKGGISTLEEKSLGCTQKGGFSEVVGVLDYTETASRAGLNLLNAPGNDLVATSALAMSGCQLVLFTTGRGTPFGSFVPTMKISTNTKLFDFKRNWIDFNAGCLLEGEGMETVCKNLIGYIIAVCNGEEYLKHEKTGFKGIAILKSGITL